MNPDTSALRGGFRNLSSAPKHAPPVGPGGGQKRPGPLGGGGGTPRGPPGVFSAAPAGPSSKKRKKPKGKTTYKAGVGRGADISSPAVVVSLAHTPVSAEVVALNFKIGQAVKQGQLPAAVALFSQHAEKLHAIRGELVDQLLGAGKIGLAVQVVKAAKAFAPLPHRNVIQCLLALPQDVKHADAQSFVEALAGASLWPSPAHENYFCHVARATVLEFLGEGARIIEGLRSGGGSGPLKGIRVVPKKGLKMGELDCGMVGSNGDEGSGFFPTDAVALTPLDGAGAAGEMGICECTVNVGRPLIITAVRKDHPFFELATSGTGRAFRIDKLANRTGYTRMMAALHCLSELDRWAKEERLQHRLMAVHRPALAVRQACVEPAGKVSKSPGVPAEVSALDAKNGGTLNPSQVDAATAAMSHAMSLVQGPPGTGKTATCVQILKLWAKTWKKPRKRSCLLATSDSNIAVDNMLEGLIRAGVKAVRLGHPEKAQASLLEHTADAKAAKSLGLTTLKECSDRFKAREALQKVIEEADVVCCTSVGAGAGLLHEYTFPRVLVDEAAQATEPSTLVPICRGCERLVLVGDHCQLPPTVSSDMAARAGLTLSLFERLQQGGIPPVLLAIQYRMHPAISAFPCAHFYDGRIDDGVDASVRPTLAGFAWPNPEVPICILPVMGSERHEGTSFANEAEANIVVNVARQLLAGGLANTSLGIVSPYTAQVRLIRRKLQGAGIPTGRERNGVEVGSVDGFQGREKDAIVMSTVRASPSGGIGFVADWRRANVAFTRAKRGLVVICQPLTLARDDKTWLPWLHWAKERWCDGGKMPPLPPLQTTVSSVGLSEKENAAKKGPNFNERPQLRDGRPRSPSPEWKKPTAKAAAKVALAKAGFVAKEAPLFEKRPEERSFESDDEDDDDRHDSGPSEGRAGRRDLAMGLGGISSSLGSLGYGSNRGKARLPVMAQKGSPSPFLGGAKMDLGLALTSKLGIKATVPSAPKAKPRPKPKVKVKKAKTNKATDSGSEGGGGGGGGLGLGGYASSSEDEKEDDGGSDDGAEEEEEEEEEDDEEEMGGGAASNSKAAQGGAAAAAEEEGAEDDGSSGESDVSEGFDLLDEFLH